MTADSQLTNGIRASRREDVVDIVLSRPDKRNALDLEMVRAIRGVLDDAEDAGARVVVLSGGASFCAGADIRVYGSGSAEDVARLTSEANGLVEKIATIPQVVIAAVEGPALGGGFEIVLAADLVIGGETAVLGLPEVALGLIPGWGGTQRLTAQVGARQAKAMIMLQQRVPVREAAAMGLVNQVVEAGTAHAAAHRVADALGASSATALAHVKHLTSLTEASLAYAQERSSLMQLFSSHDGREGVAAFIEKRPAVFQ